MLCGLRTKNLSANHVGALTCVSSLEKVTDSVSKVSNAQAVFWKHSTPDSRGRTWRSRYWLTNWPTDFGTSIFHSIRDVLG